MEDSELVALFNIRSTQAVEAAGKQYGTYCLTIAKNILRSDEDAEECVSDALMRAWRSIPPEEPVSVKAYLGSITRNLAIDRFRRQNAGKRGKSAVLPIDELSDITPSELNVEEEAELSELREKLNSFISGLDELDRLLFVQRYWYMLEVSELAKLHGIGKSKIKMRLLRTRRRLREYLIKEGYDL